MVTHGDWNRVCVCVCEHERPTLWREENEESPHGHLLLRKKPRLKTEEKETYEEEVNTLVN